MRDWSWSDGKVCKSYCWSRCVVAHTVCCVLLLIINCLSPVKSRISTYKCLKSSSGSIVIYT